MFLAGIKDTPFIGNGKEKDVLRQEVMKSRAVLLNTQNPTVTPPALQNQDRPSD